MHSSDGLLGGVRNFVFEAVEVLFHILSICWTCPLARSVCAY